MVSEKLELHFRWVDRTESSETDPISLEINYMTKVTFQTNTERMDFSRNDVGTIGESFWDSPKNTQNKAWFSPLAPQNNLIPTSFLKPDKFQMEQRFKY